MAEKRKSDSTVCGVPLLFIIELPNVFHSTCRMVTLSVFVTCATIALAPNYRLQFSLDPVPVFPYCHVKLRYDKHCMKHDTKSFPHNNSLSDSSPNHNRRYPIETDCTRAEAPLSGLQHYQSSPSRQAGLVR